LGDRVLAQAPDNELLFGRTHLAGADAKRIERLQKWALPAMHSAAGEKLAIAMSRVPLAPLHDLVFWTTYFSVVRRYMQTGTWHLLELGLRSLTNWV
jgi:hypothetical protein